MMCSVSAPTSRPAVIVPADAGHLPGLRGAEKGELLSGSVARGLRGRLDDGLAALQHTVGQQPSLGATVQSLRHNARAVVPGLAITAASGIAFAATVTPQLLAVGARAGALAEGLRTVPLVGGLLAQMLGSGGHFGLWGGAACIFSASLALLTGQDDFDRRAKWALAHVAQGFATSPFWTMAVAGTLPGALPGLLLAAGCMLGVSMVLAQVLNQERPSWLSGVALASLSAAGAPLGGALAGGGATAGAIAGGINLFAAAASAGLALSFGALVATFLLWRTYFAALRDDSTALLRRHRMEPDPTRHLDMPETPAGQASVFVDDKKLRDKLRSMKNNVEAGGKLKRDRLLLCGPAGTGKTDVAKGLQNYLGWPFYCIPASLIFDDPAPASRIDDILRQAARMAEITGQPVGLVFDEAEKLFPDRARYRDAGTVRGDASTSMTTTFNYLLDGPSSSTFHQVFPVVITNHPEQTDQAFRSRFSGHQRLQMQVPSPEVRRKIFQSRWKTNQEDFPPLARFVGYVPDEPTTQALEAACAPRTHRLSDGREVQLRLSGRDIDGAVTASLQAANARLGTSAGGGDQATFEALLRRHFLAAAAQHFDHKAHDLDALAAGEARPGPAAAAARTEVGRHGSA